MRFECCACPCNRSQCAFGQPPAGVWAPRHSLSPRHLPESARSPPRPRRRAIFITPEPSVAGSGVLDRPRFIHRTHASCMDCMRLGQSSRSQKPPTSPQAASGNHRTTDLHLPLPSGSEIRCHEMPDFQAGTPPIQQSCHGAEDFVILGQVKFHSSRARQYRQSSN